MKQIKRADLRMTIYVAIRTAPQLLLSGLRAKSPIECDMASEVPDRAPLHRHPPT